MQAPSGFRGEFQLDDTHRLLYSVDASSYQARPLGVAFPKGAVDLQTLARWASAHGVPLIPRAAGTSLAGQCVGDGLVVDSGRHNRRILALDTVRRRAVVEPGVIQSDLNDAVAGDGLIFGPDTSTADRCMIAGMIGNNACGARSIIHGTTREHLHVIDAVLADGSRITAEDLDEAALARKRGQNDREGAIYRELHAILIEHADTIRAHYPGRHIVRRNTGYALDELLACHPYTPGGPPFNLCKLLCGSEGTLALIAGAEIDLDPLPAHRLLVAAHFASVADACAATVQAVQHGPSAVELMDGMIIDGARRNAEARRHMGWLIGDPGAVLGIEFSGDDYERLQQQAEACIAAMRGGGSGTEFPIIPQSEMASVWEVRKAGLGLLMGIPGDAKTVTCIEDAAVAVADLPAYVEAVGAVMQRHGLACCHYGHASVGLLHLRPAIDLRTETGRETYRTVSAEVADIVGRFGGSLSGEHGDGRLRSPFIERALGPEVMGLLRRVKSVFDPQGLLNPGKIVDAPPIDTDLRIAKPAPPPAVEGAFDWSAQHGFVRAVENCNGAGVCRRSPGRGTMCPSYQATGDELHSTRGRANILRQLLTGGGDPEAAFDDPALAEAMALCLSCKACQSECPSSVDVGRFKAEWQHRMHLRHGAPWRDRLVGDFRRQAALASRLPRIASRLVNSPWAKRLLGIHPQRSVPAFAPRSFAAWYRARPQPAPAADAPPVVLVVDAFSNHQEPHIARAALQLFEAAGFAVQVRCDIDDARTWLSKGFLDRARQALAEGVEALHAAAAAGTPIVGLEPSAILGFRDEAPDLLRAGPRERARTVAAACQLFEEFVVAQRERFAALHWRRDASPSIAVHGHCHQKALVGMQPLLDCLRLIPGAQVHAIASGCCGMAGQFGYGVDTFVVSQAIGELVLFPALRDLDHRHQVCAPGTSCRHQIKDGVGRLARHPAELLYSELEGSHPLP